MAVTATSLEEFRRSCVSDYIVIAAKRGVEWLEEDAAECEAAAQWFIDVEPDRDSHLRARTRSEIAREVAVMGDAIIRREARKIHLRKGQR